MRYTLLKREGGAPLYLPSDHHLALMLEDDDPVRKHIIAIIDPAYSGMAEAMMVRENFWIRMRKERLLEQQRKALKDAVNNG